MCVCQDDLPEGSVVILYDPVQTAMGSLTVRAYRHLAHTAPDEAQVTNTQTQGVDPSQPEPELIVDLWLVSWWWQAVASFRDLFEEIPVVIRNPGIVSALLFDMQYDSKVREASQGWPFPSLQSTRSIILSVVLAAQLRCDYHKLDLSSGPYLAKNLELMTDEVDRMANHMDRSVGGLEATRTFPGQCPSIDRGSA